MFNSHLPCFVLSLGIDNLCCNIYPSIVKNRNLYETDSFYSPGADSGVAGFPLRHWTMRIVLLHADTKQEIDADIFESVTYVLHESFGDKARQSMCMHSLTAVSVM